MLSGLIFDIKRFALHDGPGIRTTIFFKGCSLSCRWCHNPEGQSSIPQVLLRADRCIGCDLCREACSVGIANRARRDPDVAAECAHCGACADVCPSEARRLAGRRMNPDEVMEAIVADRLYFDESGGGVSFSGGEPLHQADFLVELLQRCGRLDIHRAVDTSGFAGAEDMSRVAQQTDLFLFDLKLMDDDKHQRYTGVSNQPILSNLTLLAERGASIWIRVPIVPGITDDRDNIERMGAFVRSLPGVRDVFLLPYHRLGREKHLLLSGEDKLSELPNPAEEHLAALARCLRGFGLCVRIGG